MRETRKIDWIYLLLLMCLGCLVACAVTTSGWFQVYCDLTYLWYNIQQVLIGG